MLKDLVVKLNDGGTFMMDKKKKEFLWKSGSGKGSEMVPSASRKLGFCEESEIQQILALPALFLKLFNNGVSSVFL